MKKIIDLTHILSSDSPTWDGSCGFVLTTKTNYDECTPPDLFKIQSMECKAGIGTHIDAPAHCFEGEKTVEKIELHNLVTQAVVIEVNKEKSPNYVVDINDILLFEKKYGTITPHTFVLFNTGWAQHWGNKTMYQNGYVFPSIDNQVAQLLVEREITGLGIDTLSADTGKSGFPVHQTILGAGKYLVENVTNLNDLPPTGFTIGIFPMKIADATEAPVRILAFIES